MINKIIPVAFLLFGIALSSCKTDESSEVFTVDSVAYSFSFLGCNRVNRGDVVDSIPSTANKGVLERILKEMTLEKVKPELFFFLGDLVLAETDTAKLDLQLEAWVDLYNKTSFDKSGIEMVAVPGNHEMLYGRKVMQPDGKEKYEEFPLEYATKVWLRHMGDYMPTDRDRVGGKDSLVNRMTFAFIRKNIGFIVMNTDTYNPPTTENKYGLEGMIPLDWIIAKIKEYQQNEAIEHIFVLGHKPYYVDGKTETGHKGLPEGPVLWPAMEKAGVKAMLSAHVHDYQRMQPYDSGTYQVIAGNGGSEGEATFFGYTTVNILSSGKVQLIAKGFDVGKPYTVLSKGRTTVRDSTILTMKKNANPYKKK